MFVVSGLIPLKGFLMSGCQDSVLGSQESGVQHCVNIDEHVLYRALPQVSQTGNTVKLRHDMAEVDGL